MGRNVATSIALGVALLSLATSASAQGTTDDGPCYAIHVRLNGETIAGPDEIFLATKGKQIVVPLQASCFAVPAAVFEEPKVDVSFVTSAGKIQLASIASGFLKGPWDIDLADRKFPKGTRLPKHAIPKNSCVVVFHVGEPEVGVTASGCRSPR